MTAMQGSRAWGRLGSLGARLRPGTGGAWAWWRASMAAWLPLRWRRALGLDRGRLLLSVDGDAIQLRLQQAGEVRDLGHLPGLAAGSAPALDGLIDSPAISATDPLARLLAPAAASLPRWLLVPASLSLRRRLSLPAAAADRLRDVVGFEIDRQTPFAAGEVAFDARVLGRRGADGPLDVELVVVPEATLAPVRAAIGPLAGTLAGIDVAGADGVPLGVNLLSPALRRGRADAWRAWNWVLAAVAVLAVAGLLAALLDNRRAAAAEVRARIAAQAEAGRRAGAERQALVTLIEGQAFLDAERAAQPPTLVLWDEATRLLPDGTYLEKLSVEGERLMLIGLSNQAASLPEQLAASTLWRNPALAGALQPDPGTGRDRFTLTAELGRPAARGPATGAARGRD